MNEAGVASSWKCFPECVRVSMRVFPCVCGCVCVFFCMEVGVFVRVCKFECVFERERETHSPRVAIRNNEAAELRMC